jgi:hypothetical protein
LLAPIHTQAVLVLLASGDDILRALAEMRSSEGDIQEKTGSTRRTESPDPTDSRSWPGSNPSENRVAALL